MVDKVRLSPAGIAYEKAKTFFESGVLKHFDQPELSESDTRSKLIDPIFKLVLGWEETDIRRETPSAEGFADYVIGADYPHFHIEAKRIQPRFRISAQSRPRVLKLSGPHLLGGDKQTKGAIEQAAKCAPELGTEFSVVTNGDQFILFRTRLSGRSWREGIAEGTGFFGPKSE